MGELDAVAVVAVVAVVLYCQTGKWKVLVLGSGYQLGQLVAACPLVSGQWWAHCSLRPTGYWWLLGTGHGPMGPSSLVALAGPEGWDLSWTGSCYKPQTRAGARCSEGRCKGGVKKENGESDVHFPKPKPQKIRIYFLFFIAFFHRVSGRFVPRAVKKNDIFLCVMKSPSVVLLDFF
jgi:hypothetical protein